MQKPDGEGFGRKPDPAIMKKWLISLLLLGLVLGHNWVLSPSRVPRAATIFPCMGKRSLLPHVQVAVGQEFQVEWATGHDRHTYFALISKEDSQHLEKHSTRDNGPLEIYIQEAPRQLLDTTKSPMLCSDCKYHRTKRLPTAAHFLGGTVASHYATELASGSPYYRDRPAEFGTPTVTYTQYPYRTSPNDAYVSYNNPKFPWIKSVWRYEIQEGDPTEWDFALFKVPASHGPGNYILHYLWSGYYDCIDINVVNSTLSGGNDLPYPYGQPLAPGASLVANRVDHCFFDEPFHHISFPRPVYGGLEAAAASCTRNCLEIFEDGGCTGVSVFPLSLISRNWGPHWDTRNNLVKTLYEDAWSINKYWNQDRFGFANGHQTYPYDLVGKNGTLDLFSGIWRRYDWVGNTYTLVGYNQTTLDLLRALVETGTGQADPWTCVMVSARAVTSTTDKYTVVDDPLDPVWYGTCYEVVEQKAFLGFQTFAQQAVSDGTHLFRNSLKSGCISCQDTLDWRHDSYTPVWTVQDKCVQCEQVTNLKPSFTKAYPRLRAKGVRLRVDTVGAGNDAALCTLPPQFTTFEEYCLLPHLWTHPLLSDTRANADTWKWWSMYDWTVQSKHSPIVGWQSRRTAEWTTESNAYCAMLINKDPHCSRTGEWMDTTATIYGQQLDGCRCVRQDPCCLKYYRIEALNRNDRHVFDARPTATQPDPDLDPTCTASHSLLSADGTRCCRVVNANDCGSGGCSTTTGGSTRNGGAFCRGYQIPEDRCCRDWAPPCVMCPP